jgi:hypothetical protein
MRSLEPSGPRPRLTAAMLLYVALDVVGMVLFATGVLWFIRGVPLFIPGFPTGMFDAGVAVIGGILLMFWPVARMMVAMIRRSGGKDGADERSDVKGRGIPRR